MKKFWAAFLSVLCAACLIGAFVACNDKPDEPEPDGLTEYSVTVKSLGGASLKDVTVNFYDGVDRVENGTATTDATGKVTVRLEAGEYEVKLTNLPKGYIAPERNQMTDKIGTAITYYLESKVIAGGAPTGYQYSLGDVMYDFRVTTTEGSTFQLSKILEEKKMVLINFWALRCGPCKIELPFMRDAYAATYKDKDGNEKAFKDDVAIVALDREDATNDIIQYLRENELTNSFDFAVDTASVSSHFDLSGIPVTVIVDRYGVYSYFHAGYMASKEDFTNLFSGYISDDYVQIDHNNPEPDPDNPTIEYPEVTVAPVSSEVIEEAINGTNVNGEKFNGTYHVDETSKDKEFSWPWIVGKDEEGDYLYNSNTGVQKYSFATVIISYHAQKGDILAFDYDISIEAPSDNSLMGDPLYVIYNGSQSIIFTGNLKGTCYVSVALEEGDYEVTLLYNTDYANDASFRYKDIIKIRNVRLADEAEMIAKGESRDMLLDCATDWNADKNGWNTYVNVALNSEDGYYHLYNEDTGEFGPIVMLNTQYESHWDNKPIASYAAEALDEDSTNPYKDQWQVVMNYCGYASFSAYTNYVPVTEELHDALVFLVAHTEDNHKTYPNEWLELCVYFEHFGAGSAVADPIKGVAPFKAYTLHETSEEYTKDNYTDGISNGDLNEIVIQQQILPRGFFYEFSPAESAVYEFRTFGKYATICWIYDRATFGPDRDSIPQLNRGIEANDNFTVYVPMYKGKTYFVMLDMGQQGDLGTFYLSVKNVGAEKTVVESITADFYTTDFEASSIAARIVSYVEYGGIVDGMPVVIDDDDNTFPIYVDLLSGTNLTGNISLAQIFDPEPTRVLEVNKKDRVYEIKTDANGNFMFDEFDNPIYDYDKPVYEFMRDENGMPVYGADGDPIYDTTKPLYNYLYEIKKDDDGEDMYNEDGTPIYDYTKPVYKMNGEEYVLQVQFPKSYVYDANGNTLITKGGVYVTQELNYTQSEDYEYLKALIAEAKSRDESDPLYGMVQVDQKLQKILVDLVHRISDMRAGYVNDPANDTPVYVADEWLMMCYYEHTYRIKVDN